MTHYTVLVIGEDPEKLLKPYDENIEVAPHIKYTYGELVKEKHNMTMQNISFRKQYLNMNIRDFAKDWHGLKVDNNFNALSTYNPNSKWDWYSIGGRWQGMLKLKNKLKFPDTVSNGKKSFLDNKDYDEGYADQACFIDIDWDGIKKENLKSAKETWKELKEIIKFPANHHSYEIDHAKRKIKEYKNLKNYIKETVNGFTTYSIITEDGVWYSPGNMGWWGMSSETDDEKAKWRKTYYDTYLKNLAPDTLITVVDCHI